jgi:phosphoribosylformylglycinamidine cyclo-ligase
MLPEGLRARLDASTWSPPPVFRWLRATGGVPTDDMLQTFNCGLGMVVATASADADRVAKSLRDAGETVSMIGAIEKAPDAEADCIVDRPDALWRS